MEGDAKYLKRKVKAGRLDVHPSEKGSSRYFISQKNADKGRIPSILHLTKVFTTKTDFALCRQYVHCLLMFLY